MVGYALVSIRLADGKKILKFCLHFLLLISVLPALLQPSLLCMHFKESAGNIAVGALIQPSSLLFEFSEYSFCFQRAPER
jgi:hypothetical protein